VTINTISTLRRDDLYTDVWSRTLKSIAEEYNVKPRVIKLACEALNIPTPPQGHWTKASIGRAIETPPLPILDKDQPTEFSLLPYIITNTEQVVKITSLPTPVKLHPMIKLNKQLFRDYNVLDRGIICPKNRDESIPIFVTKSSLTRALALMNILFWQFDKNGWIYIKPEKKPMHLGVMVDDELINFSLKEPTKRIDHVLTKSEALKQSRGQQIWHARHDFLPSGQLTLMIESGIPYGGRKEFKDGKVTVLEDQLGLFIEQLSFAAKHKKEVRIRKAEEERLRDLNNLRRHELKIQREEEIKKRNQLLKDAENWRKADLIRQYVERAGSSDLEWTKWAGNYADLLDPTSTGEDTIVEQTNDINLDSRYY
jgi:hypothetical protein